MAVGQFLEQVEYPATKREVVEQARRAGLDVDALLAFERLPERRYSSSDQVTDALNATS